MNNTKLFLKLVEIEELLIKLNTKNKDYLNADEASNYLGISKNTLYKLTHKNKIEHYKPNGKILLFKKIDLKNYVEKSKQETSKDLDKVVNQLLKDL